jgi:putative ABC transport system permease protein
MLALALSMAGIYGVMAYSVAERTREIGIRMALGSRPGEALQLVLGRGMRLVATATGARVKLQSARRFDPATLAAACAALFAVALIANYLPARRATRVDPLVALRYE